LFFIFNLQKFIKRSTGTKGFFAFALQNNETASFRLNELISNVSLFNNSRGKELLQDAQIAQLQSYLEKKSKAIRLFFLNS
jgi:hypothetical protein